MMTEQANESFAPDRVGEVDSSLFAPGTSLIEAAERMGLGTPEEREFFATFPSDALERARSTIEFALGQSPRVPIRFFFALGPDFAVDVSAALGALGVHIILTGPPH